MTTTAIPMTYSSYIAELSKASISLSDLRQDHQKQQQGIAALEQKLADLQERLTANHTAGNDLLAQIETANKVAVQAEAALLWARGETHEAERQIAYDTALETIQRLTRETYGLSAEGSTLQEQVQETQRQLEEAQLNLKRIEAHGSVAEAAFSDIEAKHIEEIRDRYLEKLEAENAHIAKLENQLAKAKERPHATLTDMAHALHEWPSYCQETLREHVEVTAEDSNLTLLQSTLDHANLFEAHCQDSEIDEVLRFIQLTIPYQFMRDNGSLDTQLARSRTMLNAQTRHVGYAYREGLPGNRLDGVPIDVTTTSGGGVPVVMEKCEEYAGRKTVLIGMIQKYRDALRERVIQAMLNG